MSLNTTEFIAKAAGYNGVPIPLGDIVTDTVSAKKGYILEYRGDPKVCFMCGNSHGVGYVASEKSPKSAPMMLISKTSNLGYEFAQRGGDFLCEHCGWLNLHYANSTIARDGGKRIQNVFVDERGMEVMEFRSTSTENALYDILRNPPKPPYFVMINSGGTVLENMSFFARPTISAGCVVVTYGMRNLTVSPKRVFKALDEAIMIAERHNATIPKANFKKERLTGAEDLFWNRQGEDGGYSVSRAPYFRNPQFAKELSDFIVKYSRDTRVVAKMILQRHLKELKNQH